MTAAILLGLLTGCGLLLVRSGLRPTQPALADLLDRLHQPSPSTAAPADAPHSSLVRLVGTPLARTRGFDRLTHRFSADLRVTGQSSEQLATRAALAGTVGLLWAPAVAGLMALGGVRVSLLLPAWSALVLTAAGLTLPFVGLKLSADERRRGLRHALSCYLDLVAVRLAGGAGVDHALNASAGDGHGWAFAEIRHSLTHARLMGEPPWRGLDRLGRELRISELNELAASVTLAGDEGARVRTSIAAKARSIRVRGLAEAESAAQSASERMSLPVVLLMLGFVLFLGYPAVIQVLTGL